MTREQLLEAALRQFLESHRIPITVNPRLKYGAKRVVL